MVVLRRLDLETKQGRVMAFEAAVFDLFHTLIDTEHVRPEGFNPILRIADVLGVDGGEFGAFWSSVSIESETTPVDAADLVARFAASSGLEMNTQVRKEVNDLLGRYRDMAILNPEPAAVALVSRLSEQTRLGLLSNCYEREVRSWPVSPLAPFFDVSLFSYQIGAMKPSVVTYDGALNALQVDADRAVFVGNGASSELLGAREAGFRTIVHCNIFDRSNGLATVDEQEARAAQADISVSTFAELELVLR